MPFNLKEYCFVDNELNDDFVGIRSVNNNLQICFPLGFSLDNDKTIRADIKKLISVLLEHNKAFAYSYLMDDKKEIITSSFPLLAYKNVMEYFLSYGYYIEDKNIYKNSTKGRINFPRTIKKSRPIVQNHNNKNSFVYTKFQVRKKIINESELITAINRYCVYEAFSKFGFIFSPYVPPKFKLPTNKNYCIYLLENRLHNTFNDSKRVLFTSMKNMLTQSDKTLNENNFKFGTNKFYAIWERIIDRAFGVKDKEKYFPKTRWELYCSPNAVKHPLQPDSIMFYDDKIYVLDAKYYKYGITTKTSDLPDSSSITKQITYGEYVKKMENKKKIYNAFLMPYNKRMNLFGFNQDIKNIGFASGEWRKNINSFEKIQGILVDTKFLMSNYNKKSKKAIIDLCKSIENE